MLMWCIHICSCGTYTYAHVVHTRMLMWYIHICSCGTYTYAQVVHTHMLRWYIHICSGGTYTYAPDHIGEALDHIVILFCFRCKRSRPHLVCSRPHRRCSCSHAPTQMHHKHICSCGKSTHAPDHNHICSRPHHHMLWGVCGYAPQSTGMTSEEELASDFFTAWMFETLSMMILMSNSPSS